jgi:dipeptidyl aminopeptidase/acylaminoacyl peptidase
MQHSLRIFSLCILLLTLLINSTAASSGRVYRRQLGSAPKSGTTVIDTSLTPVVPGAPHGIAFTSNRDGNNEVYVMDPNGDNQSRVTDNLMNTSNDQRPDISPDGKQIVFSSNRDGNFEIFIMNSDGSDVIQLTTTSAPISNSWPRWSPDGEWIAFQSGAGTNFQIYRIRPDGTGMTQVTNYAGLNQFPAWSPDGTRFAIRRDTEIYLIDSADGSHPVRLTVTDSIPGAFNQMASFSPDGKKIAYLSNNRDNPGDPLYLSVYIMDSDGNDKVNFTPKEVGYPGTWTSRAPAWSPNGQYIYFTAVRSVTAGSLEQIFVKPSGGGDETKLTSTGANFEATVRKIYAPTVTGVTATPNVLWPANNNMVPVSLTVDVSDNSDPAPVCQITDVTSNEAGAETAWQITGTLTLDLRAQRFGMGVGRIYTITVTCTNSSQLSSTANVTVSVPHDQRQ